MRTDLSHLPEHKRADLELVMGQLFEGFFAALAKAPAGAAGQILKVVLFGSYASGRWVEDWSSGYISDYDLLVVVDEERFAEPSHYWHEAREALEDSYAAGALSAPAHFIIHDIADVRAQLDKGRYFFVDIFRHGIALHDDPDHPLAVPEMLPAQVARDEERRYFTEWMKKADEFFGISRFSISQGWLNNAAFLLHQTAERLYQCAMLTLTLYTPKLHDLAQLRQIGGELHPALTTIWPREDDPEGKRRFKLLQRAYVEARYSLDYTITEEELAWLADRIAELRAAIAAIGEAHLARPFDPDAPYLLRGFRPRERWNDA